MNPANDSCQRWNDGRHSWRHTSDGGFDPARYEVAPIGFGPAKSFVLQHHYSGSYPADRLRYGLWCAEFLVGVAVLSVPVNLVALTSVFPGLRPMYGSLELGRFVLLDEVPGNGESFFLGQVFRLAADAGIRGVLSLSDPLPRRDAGGATIVGGHVGTIYQATNAHYLGRATARTLYLLTDGTVLNARSAQKVRSQERGHRHVEERLIDLGARERRPAQDATAWLHSALADTGARRVRHRGNHRYAFALGSPAYRRRLGRHLAGMSQPYPKLAD